MRVAVFGKKLEQSFLPSLRQLMDCLQEKGIEVVCEEGFACLLRDQFNYAPGFAGYFNRQGLCRGEADMLLSIGGDGTFLDSVVFVKDSGVPVLGVNSGRLGFMANVPADEIPETVNSIASGHYVTEQREMLQLKVDGSVVPGFDYALNEVGILKAETSSLLNIHAYIGEVYLTTYWADGLVVATPTGSTAYSLSGGGPIVSPDCRNIILTPICPHNLSMRPLVVPNDAQIRLKIESRSGDFVLSMDSRIRKMPDCHRLEIRMNDIKLSVVALKGHNYYETLRNKLMWGEDKRNGMKNINGKNERWQEQEKQF